MRLFVTDEKAHSLDRGSGRFHIVAIFQISCNIFNATMQYNKIEEMVGGERMRVLRLTRLKIIRYEQTK